MKPSPDPTEIEVRERARELWERHHRPEGYEMEFWLQAERELRGERSGSVTGVTFNADAAKSGGGSDGPR